MKASAVLPAKPTRMSSPIFRTFFALGLTTMDPMLTCPSPIMQTLPPRRTHKIVVPCISAADPNRRRSRDPPRGANNPRHRDAMNTTDRHATDASALRLEERSFCPTFRRLSSHELRLVGRGEGRGFWAGRGRSSYFVARVAPA